MQSTPSRNIQLTTEIKETEAQSKFFNERVSQIETYFGDLCAEFINYTRRTAKLRNNGDELSKILLNYSVNEKINRTTARTLKKFAELLSTLEDYRHAEVDRLFAKVVTPLSTYGDEVKRIKTNIKVETAARKKEVSQLKRLGREPLRGTEERINIATRDALRSADALERHVIQFEAKKLKGLKNILTDFVHIEMLWHAKALETLTDAFNVVQSMQEEVDLADFRNTLFRSGTLASLDEDHLPNSHFSLDQPKSRSVPALNSSPSNIRSRQAEQQKENLVRGRNASKLDYRDDDDYDNEMEEEDDEEEELSEEGDEDEDEEEGEEEEEDEEEEEGDDPDEEEEEEEDESDDQPPIRVSHKPPVSMTPLKSALKHSIRTR
ncbi:Protein FAM92A-A [Taenia crassiceps]|uniref:Protein FAM92A-A n=1 Tax=Taenia crassiceps TaxID=6207 RepID=A0ABR4Q0E0_9CEST